MASDINTLYRQQLCRLNPKLPQVIEHFLKTGIVSRSEASKLFSMSNQFNRLLQILTEKGKERKEAILSEIESFIQSQKLEEEEEGENDRCYMGQTPHHKHMYVQWDNICLLNRGIEQVMSHVALFRMPLLHTNIADIIMFFHSVCFYQ